MIKLALRDDDVNFFTKTEDLISVYKELNNFPVSYAVIPTVLDVSTVGLCPETRGNMVPRYIGDNSELCSFLTSELSKEKCDILLHGITHEYKFLNGIRMAEMEWRKDEDNLSELVQYWKNDLSTLFSYQINCFVAPSNKITKSGIRAVYNAGMNYSGIIPIKFNREFNFISLKNYLFRWRKRILNNLPYPNILDYKTHLEINACIPQNKEYLIKMFHYCESIESSMVVNVHYWHLRDNSEVRTALFEFIDYALKCGAKPARMSEILRI